MGNEHERDEEGKKVQDTPLTINTGSLVTTGEGLTLRAKGPTTDGIRTSDSRGWDAAADIRDGVLEMASASGIKSEGEHLTLDTAEILARRLNSNGDTWAAPKRLGLNDGDDCEALDTRGPHWRYPPLRVQVTRPKMPDGFWQGITEGSSVPPGRAQNLARALWDAIEDKRPSKPQNVILAINAIRTPWFIQIEIVEAFRRQHSHDARQVGFREIWVVGPTETLTERLDIDGSA